MLLTSAMLAVNQVVVRSSGAQLGSSRGIKLASLLVALLTLLAVLVVATWTRPGLRRVPRLATDVWRNPPGDWVALVTGVVLAAPLMGFYWPREGRSSDSARLLSSVDHVWRGDPGYLVDVQEPLLPHVLHGLAMEVGGVPAARFLVILSLMGLAGVTALITYRITRSMVGAAVSTVGLACIYGTLMLAVFTPLYPVMLTLGYLGGWCAYRAVTDQGAGWRYPVIAGACIAMTPEAHAVGQIFLGVPAVVALLAPTRRLAVVQTVRTYVVVGLATLPRLAINLAEDGLDWVTTYRTDWWVTQGYIRYIQVHLWDYGAIEEPLGEYYVRLPGRFYAALGGTGWVILASVAVGWVCCRWRQRRFVLAAAALMLASITVKQVPGFTRYYSPVYPGMAIMAGVFVAAAVRRSERHMRLGVAVSVVLLLAGAVVTFGSARDRIEYMRAESEAMPLQRLVASIDDDRGVIGARAHQSVFGISAENPTWGDQYLTEGEYVTYLTWPSDEAIIDLLESHDIGWVLIHGNRLYEQQYNDVWLVPFHGRPARHIEAVASSPRFCPWFQERGFALFKLGPCPEGRTRRAGVSG